MDFIFWSVKQWKKCSINDFYTKTKSNLLTFEFFNNFFSDKQPTNNFYLQNISITTYLTINKLINTYKWSNQPIVSANRFGQHSNSKQTQVRIFLEWFISYRYIKDGVRILLFRDGISLAYYEACAPYIFLIIY